MLPSACDLGQHFQAQGRSFCLYGPTLGANIFFLPAVNWLASWFVYATLSLNWQNICRKSIKQMNDLLIVLPMREPSIFSSY